MEYENAKTVDDVKQQMENEGFDEIPDDKVIQVIIDLAKEKAVIDGPEDYSDLRGEVTPNEDSKTKRDYPYMMYGRTDQFYWSILMKYPIEFDTSF